MAKISRYAHLKPEVLELFQQGLKVADVRAKYPNLPTSTAFDWYKEFQLSGTQIQNEMIPDSDSGMPSKPIKIVSALQKKESVSYLTPTDHPNPREEVRALRRYLWQHIKYPNDDSSLVFQGASAYLRAIQVEYNLPDLTEIEDDDTATLPIDKRAERINELLERARTRRTG